MIEIRQTADFRDWLSDLRDQAAARRIVQRIARLHEGLFGDVKYFDGIGEMRIDVGPGYRLYFVRRGQTIVILLCGGDKSTQQRDIRKALVMSKEV